MISHTLAPDYIVAGRRWSGPRIGGNWAGCIAWLVGFLVGIPEHIPGVPATWVNADNPSGLYSFAVGFAVYLVLAKAGFCPARAKQLENEQQMLLGETNLE